jgi:hypothetical protein
MTNKSNCFSTKSFFDKFSKILLDIFFTDFTPGSHIQNCYIFTENEARESCFDTLAHL